MKYSITNWYHYIFALLPSLSLLSSLSLSSLLLASLPLPLLLPKLFYYSTSSNSSSSSGGGGDSSSSSSRKGASKAASTTTKIVIINMLRLSVCVSMSYVRSCSFAPPPPSSPPQQGLYLASSGARASGNWPAGGLPGPPRAPACNGTRNKLRPMKL